MTRRLLALLCALAIPLAAQTTYIPSAPAQTQDSVRIEVARSEKDVMITWSVPGLEIKQFEIYRNTKNDIKGRTRAAALRTEPAIFLDQVPDVTVTYWYWLKITLTSGQILNVGPVATPDANVWTP